MSINHQFYYPSSEQLTHSATGEDKILRFVNDLHQYLYELDRNLCIKLALSIDEPESIPGVPTGINAKFGKLGEVADVLEEIRKLLVRQKRMLSDLGV